MVAEAEATVPPTEEICADLPKVATAPSVLTEAAPAEKEESRDVVDTPKSGDGDITPSSARNEFIFSPQVAPVKKAKSNESKESAKAEETPVEAAEDKEEVAVEEPAAEEPAAEEVAEETPAVEEKVEEEAAPVEEPTPAPVEEKPSMIMAFLDKATALCGSAESAAIVSHDLAAPPSPEAKGSESVAKANSAESDAKTASSTLTSPLAKAKAALSCSQDVTDDAVSVSVQSTIEKEAVSTEKEDVEEKDAETPATEEEDKPVEEEEQGEENPKEAEPEPTTEEPSTEEAAPAVAAAPKKKKVSMMKRMSKKFKGVKKVISFRTSKSKVVVKAEE